MIGIPRISGRVSREGVRYRWTQVGGYDVGQARGRGSNSAEPSRERSTMHLSILN